MHAGLAELPAIAVWGMWQQLDKHNTNWGIVHPDNI